MDQKELDFSWEKLKNTKYDSINLEKLDNLKKKINNSIQIPWFVGFQELQGDFLLNPTDDFLSNRPVLKAAKIYSDSVKPRQIWEAKRWLQTLAEHQKCKAVFFPLEKRVKTEFFFSRFLFPVFPHVATVGSATGSVERQEASDILQSGGSLAEVTAAWQDRTQM